MTDKQFLKSTLRQLLILEDLHSNYFRGNLIEVAISILGQKETKEEIIEVDSLGAMFR